jgi:hypothetical protein
VNLSNQDQTQNQYRFDRRGWHTIESATTGGTITSILILKSESKYLIDELPQPSRARL